MKKLKTTRADVGPRLTFYTHLTTASVDFETFKKHVEKRIRILKQIEETVPDIRHFNIETQEEDILSHFFCRVICSQMPWAAIWFVNTETALFRLRVSRNLADAKTFFVNEVLPHMNGSETRNDTLVLGVGSRYDPDSTGTPDSSEVLVHFTKLIDLVGKRAVIPTRGYLKLDENCIRSLLVNEFRRYLGARMDTLTEMSQIDPDERMQRLCADLLMNPTKVEKISDFSLMDSQKHFPLCIQMIMERLKKNKHLKYNDRQTLCLFLKDCGMTVDDSITFFRSSFKVSRDVFNKEYLYSIRHNYGLEGKRANYACFNCVKIANTTNEKRESSCPFTGDEGYVRSYAESVGVDIEDILGRNSFNGKCTKLLEALTRRKQDKLVSTPIRYYFEYKGSNTIDEKKV